MQIFGSTTGCSNYLGISQSSCSRRYRSFSAEFNLGITRANGGYQASSNGDILDSLRQTAQKLRLQRGQFRYVVAWPCGEMGNNLQHRFPKACAIPIAPMGCHGLLTLLDLRLVDLVICGLMELQGLLPQPLNELDGKRLSLTATVHALPLCRWELRLMAHHQHPLAKRRDLEPHDLQLYPSPALPLGTAPQLMQQLTHRGLGTSSSRLELHSLKHWEAAAADGQSLSYAAPHQLQRLDQEFGLLPLPHPLGIHETLALIAQATTLQVANPMLDLLRATLRHHPQAVCDGMEWLGDDGAAAARSSLAPA
ncbi:MAG: hypothetical protein ACK550_13925 [Synechococcaceae cyanobacterium]